MLKAEAVDIKDYGLYYEFDCYDKIKIIYNNVKTRQAEETIKEIFTPEHKDIDNIVFDHLKLPHYLRKKIIEHLLYLINRRSTKSKR